MLEGIMKFFRKFVKAESPEVSSKDAAKERLHLVLMQDRANVSADFLEMMKQEIIEVIKKYIDVDENAIDVRLTNKTNEDGTNGAPALYANIPIISIKEESKEITAKEEKTETKTEEKVEDLEKEEMEQPKKEEEETVKEIILEPGENEIPKEENENKEETSNLEIEEKKENNS